MPAPLLAAGLITSGVSLLGSLFAGGRADDPEAIYDAAKQDIDNAYKSVLGTYSRTFDEAYKNAMAQFPQAREQIMEAYSLEKNQYLKNLMGNLDQQRQQLDVDLERARVKGSTELKRVLGGWIDSGRKAAQVIKQQQASTEQASRARLAQETQQNQLLSNVGLTQAGALTGLAGQEAQFGAGAQIQRAEGVRGIGQQYLGGISGLAAQQAGQQTSLSTAPTPAQQAFGAIGQVGGALIGAGLGGIDPARAAGFQNPAQAGQALAGGGGGATTGFQAGLPPVLNR